MTIVPFGNACFVREVTIIIILHVFDNEREREKWRVGIITIKIISVPHKKTRGEGEEVRKVGGGRGIDGRSVVVGKTIFIKKAPVPAESKYHLAAPLS